MQKKKGFSVSEMMIAMGLIGILAVTMISLNKFNSNNYQVAQTRLAQVDSSLAAWGKALIQNNETGLGATQQINNVQSLANSLADNFGLKTQPVIDGGGTKASMTLANGVQLDIEYTLNRNIAGIPNIVLDETLSPIAVITANAGAGTEPEEYVLFSDQLGNVGDLYPDYEKEKITKVPENPDDPASPVKPLLCLDNSKCGPDIEKDGKKGCEAYPEYCQEVPTCGEDEYVYVKKDSSVTNCSAGQTGQISITNIANACGTYQISSDTCCTSPLAYAGLKDNVKVCSCVKTAIEFNPGEIFKAGNELPCKQPSDRGQYALNGDAMLCGIGSDFAANKGYFCNETGLGTSKLCPKGYYCPSTLGEIANKPVRTDKQKRDLFHSSKFDKDGNELSRGGLIDALACPPGYYCPSEGMLKPTICPKGFYCSEGAITPTPCPAGTYNNTEGATSKDACKPCEGSKYQDKEGQTECKDCPTGTIVNDKHTACIGCKAGEQMVEGVCVKCEKGFYNPSANGACTPCPAGFVSTTKGATQCIPCNCNKYQKGSDHTKCISIIPGEHTIDPAIVDENGNAAHRVYNNPQVGITDKQVEKCPKGYKCPELKNSCGNGYEACEPGTYQNEEGKTTCKDCEAGTANNKWGLTTACPACKCSYSGAKALTCNTNIPAGYYLANASGVYAATNAVKTQICAKNNYCAGGCAAPQACPSNSSTSGTGAVSIKECKCNTGYGVDSSGSDLNGSNYCRQTNCGEYSPNGSNVIGTCTYDTQYSPVGSSGCYNVPNATIHKSTSNMCSYMCRTSCSYPKTKQDLSTCGCSCPNDCPAGKKHDDNCNCVCIRTSCPALYPAAPVKPLGYAQTKLNPNTCNCDCPSSPTKTTGYNTGSVWHGSWAVYWPFTDGTFSCSYSISGSSPIVLDLKHNGLEFTSVDEGVEFDLDADGTVDKISWTTEHKDFDDAFLILDKNENGQVDNGSELFGDQQGEESGFEELAKYDSNKDGLITPDDEVYTKLQLWSDNNKNAKVDEGELRSLTEERISELSTDYQKVLDENGEIKKDEHGNVIGYVGQFKHFVEEIIDGIATLVEKIGTMIDVFFELLSVSSD